MRRQISPEELDYLFHSIGAAIWHLQSVENALVPLIIFKGVVVEPNSVTESEALDLEAKFKALPLGKLIGKLVELKLVSSDLIERLRAFNNERKWIVHNSVFESGDHLYTDTGRNRVFSRLEAFIAEAIALHKHIGELIIEYSISKGITRDQIESHAISEIKRLKGER